MKRIKFIKLLAKNTAFYSLLPELNVSAFEFYCPK